MSADVISALAGTQYVLLTTFRKSDEPVSTPVWVVGSGDGRLLVNTAGTSGKVKRILANPRVELTPCDMRGGIGTDAVALAATAEVLTDSPSRAAAESGLRKKYGLPHLLIRAASKLRGTDKLNVVVRITVAPEG
ncbi:PPOX class F420-dependent oxidoreductase [Leifsonia kafniensis]|uniref:PPOX class F420-dependent oxidoreductase n=1 Tax=Leifsonia kafniensis TaxID=475957 RepID=A0ABP7KBW2_9MICO